VPTADTIRRLGTRCGRADATWDEVDHLRADLATLSRDDLANLLDTLGWGCRRADRRGMIDTVYRRIAERLESAQRCRF